jgi:hypothetical protein
MTALGTVFLLMIIAGMGPTGIPILVPHSEHQTLAECIQAAQLPEVKARGHRFCAAMPPRGWDV